MKRRSIKILGLGLLTVLLAFVAPYVQPGIRLTLRNVDTQRLEGVVVRVTGNSYDVGGLDPGQARTIRIGPDGESHIEVEHGQGVERRRLVIDVYLEPGYRGTYEADITGTAIQHVDEGIILWS